MKFQMQRLAFGPWKKWAIASLLLAAVPYAVQQFFYAQTIASCLALTTASLLAYLVLLFKISERQAALSLEAECAEWR